MSALAANGDNAAALHLNEYVDTVIVGTGPSALILSFILHGNIPYYDVSKPHPDPILHKKLSASPCLLQLDIPELTAHFDASRISYSTQALPVNVLLDTLLRPLSDIEPGEHAPSLVWRKEPDRAVKHVLIGDAPTAGGQWASNPVHASWDIGTLSYLEQLSLPQYTLFDHLKISADNLSLGCERPTRRQVADYLATYPTAVGIHESIRAGTVDGVSRNESGFQIASHRLECKHLVLASGIFTKLIPPPLALEPLATLDARGAESAEGGEGALLVIGSGFSAADIIISSIEKRQVIHVFRWQPSDKPSPLQACHPQAYPDYAGVYRQMKKTTKKVVAEDGLVSPTPRKQKQFFDEWTWSQNYVGLPNAEVGEVKVDSGSALVQFHLPDGQSVTHRISSLAHVIGRRGSLDYLSPSLLKEVVGDGPTTSDDEDKPASTANLISGRTLREKVELGAQVAPSVFAIGSLSGDSLIRFAFGGCVESAGQISSDLQQVMVRGEARSSKHTSGPLNEKLNGFQHPDHGGHEDLGRSPEHRSLSVGLISHFKRARRKSSCLVI